MISASTTKKWTVWQIHNSVAAEINISSSSLQVQDYITGNDHEISETQLGPRMQSRHHHSTQSNAGYSSQTRDCTMQMSHANHRRHHLDSGGHNQGNRVVNAGTPDEQELLHTQVPPMPGPSLCRVLLPARLPGIRCYNDAFTAPDTPSQVSRQPALGYPHSWSYIFILYAS
jgi:hypothetical protein